MNLSIKETRKVNKFIESVKKRINDEQSSDVNSSDPSRSPIPGSAAGSAPIRESISSKRRKRKERKYTINENIRKYLEDTIGGTHLETPSKRTK